MKISEKSRDYYRIEKAILFLKDNHKRNPGLKEIARHVSLSEYHFERLFKRWAGISPKKFLHYISREQIIKNLLESDSILEAAVSSGLSSQSRLYDLVVNLEAVTPGELKSSGMGLTIQYGLHHTPFGKCQIAVTKKGICSLIFLDEDKTDELEYLRTKWQNAVIARNQRNTLTIINNIFYDKSKQPLKLYAMGTNFQIKVWEALLEIPAGNTVSYKQVAKSANNPKGARAVANAIANNPISYLIPCHRVIRSNGIIHNYRWGAERKKALIGWEQAKNCKGA